MKRIMIIIGVFALLFIAGCGTDYLDCKAVADNTTEFTEAECMDAMIHECIPATGISRGLLADKMDMTVNEDCSVESTILSAKAGLEHLEDTSMTCFWDNETKTMTGCKGETWDLIEDEVDKLKGMMEE